MASSLLKTGTALELFNNATSPHYVKIEKIKNELALLEDRGFGVMM